MKQNKKTKFFITATIFVITVIMMVMVVKPGAAVFFVKKDLNPEMVEYSDRLVVYPIDISESFFDLNTLLVRMNGQIFPRIKTEELPDRVEAAFAVEHSAENQFIVRTVPGTIPVEESHLDQIQILVRPRFITQPWFKFIGISLFVGFALSAISIILRLGIGKRFLARIWGILSVGDRNPLSRKALNRKMGRLLYASKLAVFVAFFYVFMEWLFFVTKPSFMDILTYGQKSSVLILSGLGLWLLMAVLIAFIFCLDILFSTFLTSFEEIIYSVPSAIVLTGIALILFDNFTYTVFRFGVVTVSGWARLFYIVGILVTLYFSIKAIAKQMRAISGREYNRFIQWSAGLILLVSLIFLVIQYKPVQSRLSDLSEDSDLRTPNIILVSDDGLNAENMSLYGYERETTPFLDSIAPDSLLMLNNFSNSNT